jgi:aryl-alcohol dehydrogenase-like predicted oxidoreductase
MQALHDVVQTGKVRYIGMSSCFAYQCMSSYHISACALGASADLLSLISFSPSDAELRHQQPIDAFHLVSLPFIPLSFRFGRSL